MKDFCMVTLQRFADKLITTIKIYIMHECKTVTLRTRPLKNRMLSFYLLSKLDKQTINKHMKSV